MFYEDTAHYIGCGSITAVSLPYIAAMNYERDHFEQPCGVNFIKNIDYIRLSKLFVATAFLGVLLGNKTICHMPVFPHKITSAYRHMYYTKTS